MSDALQTWWKVSLVEAALVFGTLAIVVIVFALRELVRRWWR